MANVLQPNDWVERIKSPHAPECIGERGTVLPLFRQGKNYPEWVKCYWPEMRTEYEVRASELQQISYPRTQLWVQDKSTGEINEVAIYICSLGYCDHDLRPTKPDATTTDWVVANGRTLHRYYRRLGITNLDWWVSIPMGMMVVYQKIGEEEK